MPSLTINNTETGNNSETGNNAGDLPFAVSMGEPAGIGPEVILKCWQGRKDHDLPSFFVIGSLAILRKTAQALGMDIAVKSIPTSPDRNSDIASDIAAIFHTALPVLDIDQDSDFEFGRPSKNTAPMVIEAIDLAVDMIYKNQAAGLVTAPIQKSILYEAGFSAPGHTEYLSTLCQKKNGQFETPVMMLVSKDLRVVPLTIHMALKDVTASITPELIRITCQKIHTALQRDFGLENPRLAVAGLNPHAGEDGAMGDEEERIIRPALDRLRAQGMTIAGPLPADTMFHGPARKNYDAALCMYHDQALIPIKTLDFEGGVNVTVGLPIVRTSPDHGTALNIAGKNIASPISMINALKTAKQIAENRNKWAASHV